MDSAYTRILWLDKAVKALEQAHEFLKGQSMIKKLYYLTRFDSGTTLYEKCRSLISKKEKARWIEKFERARDLSEHTKEPEELDELFAKDSIKRMGGAAAMVKAWKKEYRSIA